MSGEILTIQEVAKLLKVADKTVYMMAQKGALSDEQEMRAFIEARLKEEMPRGQASQPTPLARPRSRSKSQARRSKER